MKFTFYIKAERAECLRAWIEPRLLDQWISTTAILKGSNLALTSRVPNISGRHFLRSQSDDQLIFDWYIDGFRTELKLDFVDKGEGTLLKLEHKITEPVPEGLTFPPGLHYGDQVWIFAMYNLRFFLETGEKAMSSPWPHNAHMIELEIAINVNADRVWYFLTDVNDLKHSGLVADGAKIDGRVGGRYSFGWTDEEENKTDGPGFVTEWVERERLTVTWYGGRDSTINWSLTEVDANTTRLILKHTGLLFSPADTLSYQFGWSEFLLELKVYLEHGELASGWIQNLEATD